MVLRRKFGKLIFLSLIFFWGGFLFYWEKVSIISIHILKPGFWVFFKTRLPSPISKSYGQGDKDGREKKSKITLVGEGERQMPTF